MPDGRAHYNHERGAILFLESVRAYRGVAHDPFTEWYEFETSGAFNAYRKMGTRMEGLLA